MPDITLAEMAARLEVAVVTLKRHTYTTKKLAAFGRLLTPRQRVYAPEEEAPMRAILKAIPRHGRPTISGQLASLERGQQALQLHRDGKPYSEIARALGYADASGAQRAAQGAERREARGHKRRRTR